MVLGSHWVITSTPVLYEDEAHWIGKSYFFDLALKKDFSNSLWKSVHAYDQPKLGEYMIGAWLYPQYLKERYTLQQKFGTYDYLLFLVAHNFFEASCIDCDIQYEQAYKKKALVWNNSDDTTQLQITDSRFGKTKELVMSVRTLNQFLYFISGIGLYLIGSILQNSTLGIIIMVLFLFHPVVIEHYLLAHADALFFTLFIFSIYQFLRMQQTYSIRKTILFALLGGLTMATKLHGSILLVYTLLTGFLSICIDIIYRRYQQIRKHFVQLILTFFLFLSTFILINPYTWANPFTRVKTMFQYRQKLLTMSLTEVDGITTTSQKINTIYSYVVSQNGIQYKQIKYTYPFWITIILLIGGLAISIDKSRRRNVVYLHCIGLSIVTGTIVFLQLTVSWARYFIPFILFEDIYIGVAIMYLLDKGNDLKEESSSPLTLNAKTIRKPTKNPACKAG